MGEITLKNFRSRAGNPKKWRKDDLIKFCQTNNLDTQGTIMLLNQRILEFCEMVEGISTLSLDIDKQYKVVDTQNLDKKFSDLSLSNTSRDIYRSPPPPAGFKRFNPYRPSQYRNGKRIVKYISHAEKEGDFVLTLDIDDGDSFPITLTMFKQEGREDVDREILDAFNHGRVTQIYIDGYCDTIDQSVEMLYRIGIMTH
jgi:hypothetical protein